MCFFHRADAATALKTMAMTMTSQKPKGFSANGTGTFMPQRLKNNVGMARMIVMLAKTA